uniref:Uncharacterized protein n=1 Tax=Chromera velia CCMP2878 TaxID=1169474 RepID=A0A0G4F9A1_9ALVE|eukprot:Cvel_15831.t1-p1 / transcript=Cvel_15831.t1 / gene=Cvel_15831 / organism=Chromera_velia_CCMP2878 / gene_product=hypothetical protein / transcript_product=hypothetical protein / location=Cvel_scaffold1190:392-4217(-) / protein_length=494 / sequence_SO=supercontig / SO=protein_coding / is_pseudo=false
MPSSSAPRQTSAVSDQSRARPTFTLGLACGKNLASYAVIRYPSAQPLKVGLIDLSGLSSLNERTAEALGVLRVVRSSQQKNELERRGQRDELRQGGDGSPSSPSFGWILGVQELSRVPHNTRDAMRLMEIQKLHGALINDVSRVFDAQPLTVSARHYRQFIGVDPTIHPQRQLQKTLEAAQERVPSFPMVKTKDGAVAEQTYMMAGAWAVAVWARHQERVAETLRSPERRAELRRGAEKDRRVRGLREAISNVTAKEGRDSTRLRSLHEALQSRVRYVMEEEASLLVRREDAASTRIEGGGGTGEGEGESQSDLEGGEEGSDSTGVSRIDSLRVSPFSSSPSSSAATHTESSSLSESDDLGTPDEEEKEEEEGVSVRGGMSGRTAVPFTHNLKDIAQPVGRLEKPNEIGISKLGDASPPSEGSEELGSDSDDGERTNEGAPLLRSAGWSVRLRPGALVNGQGERPKAASVFEGSRKTGSERELGRSETKVNQMG